MKSAVAHAYTDSIGYGGQKVVETALLAATAADGAAFAQSMNRLGSGEPFDQLFGVEHERTAARALARAARAAAHDLQIWIERFSVPAAEVENALTLLAQIGREDFDRAAQRLAPMADPERGALALAGGLMRAWPQLHDDVVARDICRELVRASLRAAAHHAEALPALATAADDPIS